MTLVAAICGALAVLCWPSLRRPGRRPSRESSTGSGSLAPQRWQAAGRPPELGVPLVLDLVCAALDGGLPTATALQAAFEAAGLAPDGPVGRALEAGRLGAPVVQAWADVGGPYAPLARALVIADHTGASVSTVLRQVAQDEREAHGRRAQVAARRLGVRLVLPLGLATLPAFVLLGVAPTVLGLASSLLGVV